MYSESSISPSQCAVVTNFSGVTWCQSQPPPPRAAPPAPRTPSLLGLGDRAGAAECGGTARARTWPRRMGGATVASLCRRRCRAYDRRRRGAGVTEATLKERWPSVAAGYAAGLTTSTSNRINAGLVMGGAGGAAAPLSDGDSALAPSIGPGPATNLCLHKVVPPGPRIVSCRVRRGQAWHFGERD